MCTRPEIFVVLDKIHKKKPLPYLDYYQRIVYHHIQASRVVEGANHLCLQASFCSSTAEHIPKKNQINWQVQAQSSKPDLLLPPCPQQGNQPRIFTGRPDAEAGVDRG